jgi:hypothetical protein
MAAKPGAPGVEFVPPVKLTVVGVAPEATNEIKKLSTDVWSRAFPDKL